MHAGHEQPTFFARSRFERRRLSPQLMPAHPPMHDAVGVKVRQRPAQLCGKAQCSAPAGAPASAVQLVGGIGRLHPHYQQVVCMGAQERLGKSFSCRPAGRAVGVQRQRCGRCCSRPASWRMCCPACPPANPSGWLAEPRDGAPPRSAHLGAACGRPPASQRWGAAVGPAAPPAKGSKAEHLCSGPDRMRQGLMGVLLAGAGQQVACFTLPPLHVAPRPRSQHFPGLCRMGKPHTGFTGSTHVPA